MVGESHHGQRRRGWLVAGRSLLATHHAQGVVDVGVVATFLHARGGFRFLRDQAEEAERGQRGGWGWGWGCSPLPVLEQLLHIPTC